MTLGSFFSSDLFQGWLMMQVAAVASDNGSELYTFKTHTTYCLPPSALRNSNNEGANSLAALRRSLSYRFSAKVKALAPHLKIIFPSKVHGLSPRSKFFSYDASKKFGNRSDARKIKPSFFALGPFKFLRCRQTQIA